MTPPRVSQADLTPTRPPCGPAHPPAAPCPARTPVVSDPDAPTPAAGVPAGGRHGVTGAPALTDAEFDRVEERNLRYEYDPDVTALCAEVRRLRAGLDEAGRARDALEADAAGAREGFAEICRLLRVERPAVSLSSMVGFCRGVVAGFQLSREEEIRRLTTAAAERDAVLRWSVRHAGYLGTREPTPGEPRRWWARGDQGMAYAETAEEAVRRAAGLGTTEGDNLT